MDLNDFIERPPCWSDGKTVPMVDVSVNDWRADVRKAVAQAWEEGLRAAYDQRLGENDNPYA